MSDLSKADLAYRLVQLRARVDVHFVKAVERTPAAMNCRSGCDKCCHARFGVFEIEAEPIRLALQQLRASDPQLRARIRDQADEPEHADRCALLVDGRCSVYEQRPLICRSQGLPLLTEDKLDWCPLNFLHEKPPRESILSLVALNAPLSAIAAAWSGDGRRVELAELAREG
jgi:Fe-S-cluster containining protein